MNKKGHYSSTLQSRGKAGYCLDSDKISPTHGSVCLSKCDGDNKHQNWSVGGKGVGYTLKNLATDLCLNRDGVQVNAISCNWNNRNENWAPTSFIRAMQASPRKLSPA